MSVAELAPPIQTPEQLPPPDLHNEIVPPLEVDESQLATQGVSKEVRKLQDKLEKREKTDEFYKRLGEITVKIAAAERIKKGKPTPYDELKELSPRNFIQRRAATKRVKQAEKIAKEKFEQELKMRLYPTTGGSSRVALIKTARARIGAFREAKRQLGDSSEEGIGIKDYQKKKEAIGGTYVYAGQLKQEKIDKKHQKAVKKFEKKSQGPIMQEVRDTRIRSTQRKIDTLNGVGLYDRLTDVLFPSTNAPSTNQEQAPTPEPQPIEEAGVPMTPLEQLRKLQEAGVLPQASKEGVDRLLGKRGPEPEATPEKEDTVEVIARQLLDEAVKRAAAEKVPKDDIILELLQDRLVGEAGGRITPELTAKGDQILDAISQLEQEEQAKKQSNPKASSPKPPTKAKPARQPQRTETPQQRRRREQQEKVERGRAAGASLDSLRNIIND